APRMTRGLFGAGHLQLSLEHGRRYYWDTNFYGSEATRPRRPPRPVGRPRGGARRASPAETLMPGRRGHACLRFVLLAVVLVGAPSCTVGAEPLHQGEAPRWVILGDRDLAPDAAALAALAEALPPDRPRPLIVDLSTPGAGLEAVVRDQ